MSILDIPLAITKMVKTEVMAIHTPPTLKREEHNILLKKLMFALEYI